MSLADTPLSPRALATPPPPGARFDNSYARLPERFHVRMEATPVPAPAPLLINRPLADELGFDPDWLAGPEGTAALAGNARIAGAEPLAAAYAGHQFGNFVPQLGDGRALLLGEVIDRQGRRRDIQLKGSGPTPFSRRGDGRAAIGPVLREFIVSEAMHALGIPSTRALAAVATGAPVIRETIMPGAVLTRVAASHIRVGTFQFFAARRDWEAIGLLVDHVIQRHYPEAAEADRPALALLSAVADAQASLIARWMGVGFIHGVMNTDNMGLAGETIDFGPCAFMESHDPNQVFSAIDQFGRYAFANQPRIGQWNLARLAECLLPLIDPDGDAAVALAMGVIEAFPVRHEKALLAVHRAKLGLVGADEGDTALIEDYLTLMADQKADFTLAFRSLGGAIESGRPAGLAGTVVDAWLTRWRTRLGGEPVAALVARLEAANPLFIPRNHLVEAAIAAAVAGDLEPSRALVRSLAKPHDSAGKPAHHLLPAAPDQQVFTTFCGT